MSYKDEVLADSPVIYLPLEEASGNPTNLGSQTMSSYGVSATQNVAARRGKGIELSTANNYLAINYGSANNSVYTDNVFSVEFWVKTTETGTTFLTTVGYSATNYTSQFAYLYVSAGKLAMAIHGGTSRSTTSSTVINDGQWHHIVFTVNSGVKIGYVDGVQAFYQSNSHGTLTPNPQTWTLGTTVGSSAVGIYDEFAVYNSALSPERIQAHYAAIDVPDAPAFEPFRGWGLPAF